MFGAFDADVLVVRRDFRRQDRAGAEIGVSHDDPQSPPVAHHLQITGMGLLDAPRPIEPGVVRLPVMNRHHFVCLQGTMRGPPLESGNTDDESGTGVDVTESGASDNHNAARPCHMKSTSRDSAA